MNEERKRRNNLNGMGFPSWEELVKYRVEPRECPECSKKYVPTPKSPKMCLRCKSGQERITR